METDVKDLIQYQAHVANYTIRTEMLDGKQHIVVPVVMMREGVHNGSAGPIFHRAEELAKIVESWNGIPITVDHPKDGDRHISANSPEVLQQAVGRVFHTRYDEGLKAEAWLNVERLQAVSPEAYGYIMQGRPLDVSVGIFNESIATEGEWNGETYESLTINYRPDHLALLPGEQGACSWADGCGIRANQEGGSMEVLLQTFKELNQQGYALTPIVNEQGYQELVSNIRMKLDRLDTNERVHYLHEVYEDYFVYAIGYRESGDTTLYKRGYSVNDDGSVEFNEDSVEVRRKVTYETMKMARTKFNNNKNEESMSDKKENLCCEGKVDELIAHKQTRFTAADKEELMGLGEELIDKLFPVEPEEPKVEPQVNKDEVVEEFKTSLKTIEDFTALMPEEMKTQFDRGVEMYKAHRKSLIEEIKKYSGDNFSDEKLEAMEDETLEAIRKSVKPADYSGNGGVHTHANEGEELLLPAGVVANEKKEE
jgi:hypothetical protein